MRRTSHDGMPARTPDLTSEQRLAEIRREAEQRGEVKAAGVRPSGSPFPMASPETGYYGIPLLKEPAWTWEVPLYFFVGGAAGAAAVVGAIADYTGADRKLVRDARWIAAAGAVISPALLIADLGRPERFLNMMRVFKPQSPMSVGVWTLLGFSAAATATAFADFMRECYGPSLPLRVMENAGQAASLAFGLPFSNYTGVLIGATAIPVWNQNVAELPIHFGASGLSAAVGMLEMMGHRKSRALHMLGLGAAIFESWEGWRIESRQQPALDPLKLWRWRDLLSLASLGCTQGMSRHGTGESRWGFRIRVNLISASRRSYFDRQCLLSYNRRLRNVTSQLARKINARNRS